MDASSQFKDSLPTSPEALMEKLEQLGIAFSVHHHPPLRTVEDSKALRGNLNGMHVKNLYLRDKKKRNYLIVAEEDRTIDLKTLHGLIGSDRLSFGSADRLFEMLGVRPGAVSPFTLINDLDNKVSLFLDAELMTASQLFFHPLVNDMTLGVSPDGLSRFFAHTGHEPHLVTL
ncbi:MAG: prolyl-tRNA synthetase associated domain-containing protein [Alphaproteobacteria bacterium]|jgi:Ala-tRNA(Pro) deacylase